MNDERFSQNKKRYFTVDFDNATERGLKPLIKAFEKAGAVIAETVADNTSKRQDGQLQKKAQFIFNNGQSIVVLIADTGDITQTKLNSTIVPVRDLSSIDNYARELANLMSNQQARFDKALARKAAAVIKDTSNVKPATRSFNARIVEAMQAVDSATSNLEAERKRLDQNRKASATNTSELEKLKMKLSALKSEENSLVEAILAKGGTI
jgi:vacuolar-type H+-ATPase subunit I/STV1